MTDRDASTVLAALAGVPHPWAQPGVRFALRFRNGDTVTGTVLRRGACPVTAHPGLYVAYDGDRHENFLDFRFLGRVVRRGGSFTPAEDAP